MAYKLPTMEIAEVAVAGEKREGQGCPPLSREDSGLLEPKFIK
jgi:hypothetical protein